MNTSAAVLPSSSIRGRVFALIEHPRFQQFIIALIVLNAITLGIETSHSAVERFGTLLHVVDQVVLLVFVIELSLRLFVYRLRFFRDGWNIFDFVIVGIALMPASGAFSVLRALRVLRVLRLVSMLPAMRKVVGALIAALPGMASIFALLLLVMYVAAVMATRLFSEIAPEFFGDLGASMFTLFQIMTVEGWPDIARGVMKQAPWAWIFFIGYLLTATFTVLNLFIAVVVNAMQGSIGEEIKQEEEVHAAQLAVASDVILEEIRALRREVEALRVRG